MSYKSVDVLDLFPHKTFTPCVGKPNKVFLDKLQEKVTENLASVPSSLGGVKHGLSGLLLPLAKYHLDTGYHFLDPLFPGDTADTTLAANVAEERRMIATFMSAMGSFQTVTKASCAVKTIFCEVIDEMYLAALKVPITGLSNVPIRDIMRHLFDEHGHVTSAEKTQAEKDAQLPWDVTTPVQTMFSHIQKCADLLEAARDPFTDKQLLCYAYDAIFNTGCFVDGLKAWRRKNERDKTYPLFKLYMAEEYTDYLEDMTSNANNPYQASNVVNDETLDTLNKISDSITSDRQQITEVAQANSILSTANSTVKEEIKTLTGIITNLKQRINNLETKMLAMEGNKKKGRKITAPTAGATPHLPK